MLFNIILTYFLLKNAITYEIPLETPILTIKPTSFSSLSIGITLNEQLFVLEGNSFDFLNEGRIIGFFPIVNQRKIIIFFVNRVVLLDFELSLIEWEILEEFCEVLPIDYEIKELLGEFFYLCKSFKSVSLIRVSIEKGLKEVINVFKEEDIGINQFIKAEFEQKSNKIRIFNEKAIFSIQIELFIIEKTEIKENYVVFGDLIAFLKEKSLILTNINEKKSKNIELPAFIEEITHIQSIYPFDIGFFIEIIPKTPLKTNIFFYNYQKQVFLPIITLDNSPIAKIFIKTGLFYLYKRESLCIIDETELKELNSFENSLNIGKFILITLKNEILAIYKGKLKSFDFITKKPIETIDFIIEIKDIFYISNEKVLLVFKNDFLCIYDLKTNEIGLKKEVLGVIKVFNGLIYSISKGNTIIQYNQADFNIINVFSFENKEKILDFIILTIKNQDFLVILTEKGFISIYNAENPLKEVCFLDIKEINGVFRLISSFIKEDVFYLAISKGDFMSFSFNLPKRTLFLKEKLKNENISNIIPLGEGIEGFILVNESNSSLTVLNNRFQKEFQVDYHGLLHLEGGFKGNNEVFLVLSDDFGLKSYILSYKEVFSKEIKGKGTKAQEFKDFWPYVVIIAGSMGFFFIWIVYNIKETERILINSIKRD